MPARLLLSSARPPIGALAQDSLAALARAPHGHLVLGIVAVGLMTYGAFQLATARYRHTPAA